MPRPIWSGAISFGLVNVPVKLFSATSPKEVRFNMLHDRDGGKIHLKRVCGVDGEEVPWEHIVKGFPVSKSRYVPVTQDELAAFHPRGTKTIEIEDFVELASIDPVYYETTYYLVPDKGAAKPYALLLEAMRRTGKVGIARFVLRTKQHLCAVRPLERALALSTMLFADEIVPVSGLEGLPAKSQRPADRELRMAEQLVESLAGEFHIDKYRDDFREEVLALVKRKAEGGEVAVDETARAAPGKVVNLMEALQRSLEAARKGEAIGAPPKAPATRARRPAKSAARRKSG